VICIHVVTVSLSRPYVIVLPTRMPYRYVCEVYTEHAYYILNLTGGSWHGAAGSTTRLTLNPKP